MNLKPFNSTQNSI